jgi:RNA polymerase sigma-70 factor (ECF subfamily)
VSPNQYQIFHAYVVKEWDAARVMRELGVSQSQVYLAKHRIGAMLKEEIEKLKGDFV